MITSTTEDSLSNTDLLGKTAPIIQLPTKKGNTINLLDFKGKKVIVLFWESNCIYCDRLLESIKAFESNENNSSPLFLIVTINKEDFDYLQDLKSIVVLDSNLATLKSFSIKGFPSAIMIDENNKIASHLALGPASVSALLGTLYHNLNPSNVNNYLYQLKKQAEVIN